MRPAQIARELRGLDDERHRRQGASMRPAQIAREIHAGGERGSHVGVASMRPAQIAREICSARLRTAQCRYGFNEARANCAGNFHRLPSGRRAPGASMRPAQIAREIGE